MRQISKTEVQNVIPHLVDGGVLKVIINPLLYEYHAYKGSEAAANTYHEDESDDEEDI